MVLGAAAIGLREGTCLIRGVAQFGDEQQGPVVDAPRGLDDVAGVEPWGAGVDLNEPGYSGLAVVDLARRHFGNAGRLEAPLYRRVIDAGLAVVDAVAEAEPRNALQDGVVDGLLFGLGQLGWE